jgi:hypothetical protein
MYIRSGTLESFNTCLNYIVFARFAVGYIGLLLLSDNLLQAGSPPALTVRLSDVRLLYNQIASPHNLKQAARFLAQSLLLKQRQPLLPLSGKC